MKIDFKHYFTFLLINILCNSIGWYFSFDRLDHISYPNNLKDVFGMIFWSSLFQLLIFIKLKKYFSLILYIFIILFIPRFFLYLDIIYGYSFDPQEMMEMLNSDSGFQVLWIEPLYISNYQFLNHYIDRYILYFIMISLQIVIFYFITKKYHVQSN